MGQSRTAALIRHDWPELLVVCPSLCLSQNCLGGDSKTLMFVNVAPTREFAGESLCSLRFAAKVNACEINHGPPAATAGRK